MNGSGCASVETHRMNLTLGTGWAHAAGDKAHAAIPLAINSRRLITRTSVATNPKLRRSPPASHAPPLLPAWSLRAPGAAPEAPQEGAPALTFSEHLYGEQGEAMFRRACAMGLESLC